MNPMMARGAHTRRARITAFALAAALMSTVAGAQQPATSPSAWAGTAGAGLSLTRGNSDTVSYNVAFDVTRTPTARHLMKWTGHYLRGRQDGIDTVNRTSLAYRDQSTLSERTFLFGQVDYLRDTFKLIDYIVAPTAGLGVKVVNTDPTKFAVDAGVGAIWEKNPVGDVRRSGAITASETLTHRLTTTASIKHAATGLWKTDQFADSMYTVSAGLATRISNRVELSLDLLDTYKNQPPTAATKKNDVAIVTSLIAKFQ